MTGNRTRIATSGVIYTAMLTSCLTNRPSRPVPFCAFAYYQDKCAPKWSAFVVSVNDGQRIYYYRFRYTIIYPVCFFLGHNSYPLFPVHTDKVKLETLSGDGFCSALFTSSLGTVKDGKLKRPREPSRQYADCL